jgi:hypothetical protein
MTEVNKHMVFSMLCLITTPKLVTKATELFEEEHIPMQNQFYAQGTATSEIMDMLGLGSVDKVIHLTMMHKEQAEEMLIKLKKTLHLGMPNSGVAFTISLTGGTAGIVKLMENLYSEKSEVVEERKLSSMNEKEYTMVMAFVNQGFSEEVMSAACAAGARGGTVFHSRRVGSDEVKKFWGITVQQEREIVLILARKKDKVEIMKAINEKCGLQSEAHGIVVSLPVDNVVGLSDEYED